MAAAKGDWLLGPRVTTPSVVTTRADPLTQRQPPAVGLPRLCDELASAGPTCVKFASSLLLENPPDPQNRVRDPTR